MPGEAILVVDDAPVNLKLADLVLRKEGFQVYAVPNAEEALRVLRNLHPDMMLVDIQLPGMDGLELTRRIKLDSRTRDVVVVALTACAMRGDEERALEAGCDGYITKPINTQTFGRRIRELLDRGHENGDGQAADSPPESSPAAERHTLPSGVELSALELEGLRRRFLEEGGLQSRQMLMDLGPKFDLKNARALIHRWIGAAGALGYFPIAALARETENLLEAARLDVNLLRERLSELALAFQEPAEAALDPLPESMKTELAGKRIGLVGFALDEAERLCGVLETVGARPRLFEAAESPDAEGVRHCQAILVHVREQTMRCAWLTAPGSVPAGKALILVGNRDRNMVLDSAVRHRAHEFLIDGWQPEEALMRVVFALCRVAQRPPAQPAATPRSAATGAPAAAAPAPALANVLIADDDPAVRAVLQAAFRDQKIECRTTSSGADALRIIREAEPTAAILDINMPDMSGFEVLAAIKVASLPIRTILLSARSRETDILQAFRLGADDYVIKPFNPIEVVVRLKRLFGRP